MRCPSALRAALLAACVLVGTWATPVGESAGAATAQGTVFGEGGDAMSPVMSKLLHDDATGLAPDFGSYTNVDIDQGIADFVGSGPGTFGADFAVTERALTTSEAATAKANGRSYAYVPIAALPVALFTLVPNSSYQGSSTITPNQFCQHIPLTLQQLDGIFGAPAYSGWSDPNLSCTAPPDTPAEQYAFYLASNLDPTMENSALMSLLDSTTPSKSSFQAGLNAALAVHQVTTADPTPSEHWPYGGAAVPGGDETSFGKLIGLDNRTGALGTQAAVMKLGAIMPVADVWTEKPLGVTWNLPTAAVQNAGSDFVVPSSTTAKAAESSITLASTSDPTTNNLVTSFNAIPTDPANCATASPPSCPYNNWLMLESYLVVPTNGLPADKALALAQFIRFAVGGTGQTDIASLGAAGATPAEVTADLAVAQQLDTEASSAGSSTTSTTTSTTTAAAASTSTPSSSTSNPVTTGSTGAGSGSGSGATLATTGNNPSLLAGLGLAFLVSGACARQFLRRRKAKS
jgi:ABC-type phosphate transport system substrate-binding protein